MRAPVQPTRHAPIKTFPRRLRLPNTVPLHTEEIDIFTIKIL